MTLYVKVCFGQVLWHINYCRLFNAKSSVDIHIIYIYIYVCVCVCVCVCVAFVLVRFYGISTIAGYLMPNPL